MPTLAITCLAISLIAAVLGVGGMASPVGLVAEMLFLVFAALFVIAVLFGGTGPLRSAGQLRSDRNSEQRQ